MILGIAPSWHWLSVYSESYYQGSTRTIQFAEDPRSSARILASMGAFTHRGNADRHRGCHHAPLLIFPGLEHAEYTVFCVLHLWIALGRELARWVASRTTTPAAVAQAVGWHTWTLHPKGSEVCPFKLPHEQAKLLFNNFALAAVHLAPGVSTPALLRAVSDLAWGVTQVQVALVDPASPRLLDIHHAVAAMPAYVQTFRRELQLSDRSHYLHYLECELHLVWHTVLSLGPVQGALMGLGFFSSDLIETRHASLLASSPGMRSSRPPSCASQRGGVALVVALRISSCRCLPVWPSDRPLSWRALVQERGPHHV